ncbi:serine beta-lactamase-like protein LACTB, mitochondrial [Clytia hemisphaerica]|uniref:serine beta-lactamase-like protein LACTB, mitochondrial n=1 Tax=Clytia hemisphaerica TaxID=252671 RepID=UPI0034D543D8
MTILIKQFGTFLGISTTVAGYEWFKWNYAEASNETMTEIHDDCPEKNEVNLDFANLGKIQPPNVNKRKQNGNSTDQTSLHNHKDFTDHVITYGRQYKHVVPKLFRVLQQIKEETGSPGISFAISRDGDVIMKGGIGLADVENNLPMTSQTILRIASISKSLTSIAVGKLLEEDRINLETPIQTYLKDFPVKKFHNKAFNITTKQLLSHTSGIRGYFQDPNKQKEDKKDEKVSEKDKIKADILLQKYGKEANTKWDENLIMRHSKSVQDGLELFINDPLIYQPGTDYEYSSLAYSLVSRIIEETSGQDYVTYMKDVCRRLGMKNTCVDLNNPIIPNRGRYYDRAKNTHRLMNVPYVDNSYKWSGGGFLSNVDDLILFGNEMLKCHSPDKGKPKGTVIALIVNMQSIGLTKTAEKLNDILDQEL